MITFLFKNCVWLQQFQYNFLKCMEREELKRNKTKLPGVTYKYK